MYRSLLRITRHCDRAVRRLPRALLLVLALTGCRDLFTGPGSGAPITPITRRMATNVQTTCLLSPSGIPQCWGDWQDLPAIVPYIPGNGTVRLTSISGSGTHFCGTTAEGSIYCWGGNYHGELGDGTTTVRRSPLLTIGDQLTSQDPTRVDSPVRFVSVTAAVFSTCALDEAGQAWCWGQNAHGQLGTGGSDAEQTRPVRVATRARFTAIDGAHHICGLGPTGAIACWGRQSGTMFPEFLRKEPGDCTTVFYVWYEGHPCRTPTPLAGDVRFTAVSHGRCGLGTDQRIYCWGDGVYGQLGTGQWGIFATPPVPAATELRFRELAASTLNTCGLTLEHEAWCWGLNTYGQTGNGKDAGSAGVTMLLQTLPARVLTDQRFVTLSVNDNACGLTAADEVWCWGPGYGNVPVHISLPPVP